MGHTSRIVARPPWGIPSPRGHSFSFTGKESLERAQLTLGAIRNLFVLDHDENEACALCLSFRVDYDDADNVVTEYDSVEGGAYLGTRTFGFGDGTTGGSMGVAYSRTVALTPTTAALFYTVTDQIKADQPFALRTLIYKPPEQTFTSVTYRWFPFQIQVSKSSISIMRLSDTWTQTQENTLEGYLATDPIDSALQASIDTLRNEIYRDVTSIDIDGELWGQELTFACIPENRGVINVLDGRGKVLAQLKDSSLMAARTSAQMWPDGKFYVRSNGAALAWQLGTLQFAPTGQLRLGPYQTATSGSWTFSLLKATTVDPTVSTGSPSYQVTNVTMQDNTIDVVYNEVTVDFVTQNNKFTPFFYLGYAYRFPGTRTGLGFGSVFDTQGMSSNPVMEMTPRYEEKHRRISIEGQLRNIDGETMLETHDSITVPPTGVNYWALENATIDVYIDGTCMIKNGVCLASGHDRVKTIEPNLVGPNVFRGESQLLPLFCDQWQILDECEMEEILPVGDGLRLGRYIRDCLSLVGLTSGEMTGVSATAGRILPSARPGETWQIQPNSGTTLGDWLRHLCEAWGFGATLWIDNAGVWHFGTRSTTPVYAFTGGWTANHDIQDALDAYNDDPSPENAEALQAAIDTAAASRVFYGLRMVRDFTGAYNDFLVVGVGRLGRKITARWTIQRAVNPPLGGVPSPRYMGRLLSYPAYRSDELRSQSEANFMVRSIMLANSRVGRVAAFDSWLKTGIFPGDTITVNGVTLKVDRIEAGSLAFGSNNPLDSLKGKMSIVAREVEALPL